MKKLFYCILIAMGLGGKSYAISAQEGTFREHHTLWLSLESLSAANPALRSTAYKTALSEFYYRGSYTHQTVPFVLEEGKGAFNNGLNANTYIRLSPHSAVWGEASYTSSTRRNITWNSIADYRLLAPHTIADSIGGNTRNERYGFRGGYGTAVGRWQIGGEMAFRAEQEYRNRDPRMRSIVSDLTLAVGAARRLHAYTLSAGIFGNIYKQTNNVDFVREETATPEYFMTGLGAFNYRFSGKKTGTFYKGGGTDLLLSLNPQGATGAFATVQLGRRKYERIASEFNSLPLSTLYKERAQLAAGWKQAASVKYGVYADFSYERTSGEEAVPGDESRGDYPILTQFTMYKGQQLNAAIGAFCGKDGKLQRVFSCRTGYTRQIARYVYPERLTRYGSWFGELKGQLFCSPAKQWTLDAMLQTAYRHNLHQKITMPYVDMMPAFRRYINHNHRFAAAHYAEIKAALRADYAFAQTPYAAFLKIEGGWVNSSQHSTQTAIDVSLGIRF